MQRIAADDECCYFDVVVALRTRRPQMTTHVTPIETLDAAEVARLLNAGKLLLIDVREPSEYASALDIRRHCSA
jgi:3-mercaptopyruvate sulfurtransferase SseA